MERPGPTSNSLATAPHRDDAVATHLDRPVYKVLRADEAAAFVRSGAFHGSADDMRDGFIHLSTAQQVPGTLDKHFAGESRLFLGVCPSVRLGDALLWETSRGGRLFPHLYRALHIADVVAILPVPDDRAGWRPPAVEPVS
jgi:uncharacterized protein (DUF952 family)